MEDKLKTIESILEELREERVRKQVEYKEREEKRVTAWKTKQSRK